MTQDEYDDMLRKLSRTIDRAAKDIESLREQRVIRIINISKDHWEPPLDPSLHKCGDSCHPGSNDKAAYCDVTKKEISAAHRRAERNLAHLRRFFPEE